MGSVGLQRQDVDRMLAPEYVSGLADISLDEIRAKSADCRHVEYLFSYLRRVLQGQIDLVVREIELRKASGAAPGSHGGRLLDELPTILSGSSAPAEGDKDGTEEWDLRDVESSSAGPLLSAPVASELFEDEEGMSPDEIAAVVAPELTGSQFKGELLPGANLESFADPELQSLLDRLRRHESILSAERKVLHERITALQASVVERYKTGAADVDSLLEESAEEGDDTP